MGKRLSNAFVRKGLWSTRSRVAMNSWPRWRTEPAAFPRRRRRRSVGADRAVPRSAGRYSGEQRRRLSSGIDSRCRGRLDQHPVDVNLRAVLHLCRLLVLGMVARDCGHVINITSIAAIYNFNGNSIYHATKAGVHALSRQLRVDCYGKRVRITEICPGRVATEIFGNVSGDHEEARRRFIEGFELPEAKTSPTAWLSRSPRRWRSTSAILRSPDAAGTRWAIHDASRRP